MVCSLCLNEILGEESVTIEGNLRHKACSEEFEKMVDDLEKIYDETCPKIFIDEEHNEG